MRRSLVSVGLLLAGCGLAGACAPEGEAPADLAEAIGQVSQAIDGGYLDQEDTAVVGIVSLSNQGIGSCSGTLIAPNVVLTAQHCVAAISTGEGVDCKKSTFGKARSASSIYVTTKTSLTQNPGDYVGAKEVLIPAPNAPVCGNDIAILVLSKPIPESQAVPRVPKVDTSAEANEEYYAVGYGKRGENGDSGTRYRRDDLEVRCVGAECKAAQIADSEWLGDTGICQGDSGGPAFDLQNRVMGIVSRGGQGCILPIYGHVEPWGPWIKQVVVKATTDAGLETPKWATGFPTDPSFELPVGAACTLPADCPSNACLDGVCTRPCIAEAPCPGGYECGVQGYCQKAADDEGGGEGTTVTEVTTCSLTRGREPTKPMPWIVTAAAALALSLRSCRRGRARRQPATPARSRVGSSG